MIRYALLVAIGACSYGILSTIVKSAYAEGFVVDQVVGAQMFLGAAIVGMLAAFLGRGRPTRRQALQLLAAGVPSGLTGVFYYSSLQYVSASLAVVLLFQFTWLGVLLEAVVDRKMPSPGRLAAVALLLGGTALASGLFEGTLGGWDAMGVAFGLLSAVSYTGFVWNSGRVQTQVQSWVRSAWMVAGSATAALLIFPPRFLLDGSLASGLWHHGLLLALFGPVVPTICFNFGVPKVGSGLASILGALELPTAVLCASLILAEEVSALQWAGMAVLLIGVLVPELHARQSVARAGASAR